MSRTLQQIEQEMKEGREAMAAQLAAGIPFDQCVKGPDLYDEWLAAKKIEENHRRQVIRAIESDINRGRG